MNCYSCDRAATNACKRCAKPYCEDHGNATYCAECLQPASALPSFNLYRGALLVMLVGTAVAVFLLVRPPGETTSAPVVVGRLTPTPTASGGEPAATPTAADVGEPPRSGTETRAAGTPGRGTPAAAGTGTPAATPTPPPFIEYVIQDGDTLYDIAEANLPPGDDIDAYARAIANLNGIDFDAPVLTVGETILLPPLPE